MNKKLVEKLQIAGLLSPNAPKNANSTINAASPWYISALMGLCGWLAGLFFMAFIGLAVEELYENGFALSLLGIACISIAYIIITKNESEFFKHACIAMSCAGQLMIAFALFQHFNAPDSILWFLVMTMQIALMALMPITAHRFLSALFATISFAMLLNEASEFFSSKVMLVSLFSPIVMWVVAFLWLNEFTLSSSLSRKAAHKKVSAIAYGITLGLIIVKITLSFNAKPHSGSLESWLNFSPLIDEILCIGVLLFFGFTLYKQHHFLNDTADRLLLIGFTLLVCTLTLFANGIALSILLILLGYCSRNKILASLGLLSTLVNISVYYYSLEISLLDKSFILLGTGVFALGLFGFNKRFTKLGENNHE